MIWDDARVFLAVARTGSLSGAAGLLGVGVATISRKIERLEVSLEVPLFVRHQTGYRLTDEGAALLPKAENIELAAVAFRSEASTEAEVAGVVRLATAENFANLLIIPSLSDLLAQHPKLSVEVVTDVSTVNLHRRDADLAVRMVKPVRGNLTRRQIGTMGYGLYASAAYLAAREGGSGAKEFEHDQFIAWTEHYGSFPGARWIAKALRGRPPIIATTSLAGQVSAAKAGPGLAVLPHFVTEHTGFRPLPIDIGIEEKIWMVIHSDLSQSRRVRAVADHITAVFERERGRLATPAKANATESER